MDLSELIDIILQSENFVDSISRIVVTAGAFSIALILLIGVFYLFPIIIATIRNSKLRKLICVLNVLNIIVLVIKPLISVLIWLTLVIVSILTDTEVKKQNTIPMITFTNNKEN